MRFTRHYAGSTVCALSRGVLLTGRRVGRAAGHTNWDAPLPDATPTKGVGPFRGC